MKTVDGVLLDVESASLTETTAVTFRADDGRERRWLISGEAMRADHVPSPGHLRQHMTNGDRITIRYRDEGVALEVAH